MGQEFTIGHSYLITIDSGKVLTFTCKIIGETDAFVTFIDKYGKTITYNKLKIIAYEKLQQ